MERMRPAIIRWRVARGIDARSPLLQSRRVLAFFDWSFVMTHKQTTSILEIKTSTAKPAMQPLAADQLRHVTGGGVGDIGGTGAPQAVGGIGGSGKQ
jgi:hypothetical protein